MRVSCPNCSAEYDLPPAVVARLDGARTVRCARCGTTWAPEPPPPVAAAAPAPVVEVKPEPVRDAPRAAFVPEPVHPAAAVPIAVPVETTTSSALPDFPPPPAPPPLFLNMPPAARARVGESAREGAGDGPRVALAWTLSLVLLAAGAWAAWHYRAEVMAAWPPSIRAYAALGLVP